MSTRYPAVVAWMGGVEREIEPDGASRSRSGSMPYCAVYYVQRFNVPVEPALAGQRLAAYMRAAGFRSEDSGCVPCARFERGKVANNFFVISPRAWGVTIDTRIEPNEDGGSNVDACWAIQTVSQIVTYAETKYWRTAMAELKEAVGTGTVGPERSDRAARSSILFLSVLILGAGAVAIPAAVFIPLHVLGTNEAPLRAVLGCAIWVGLLFASRDWRGLRD